MDLTRASNALRERHCTWHPWDSDMLTKRFQLARVLRDANDMLIYAMYGR